jgi:tetratricopeptide (TPR) repeat protein
MRRVVRSVLGAALGVMPGTVISQEPTLPPGVEAISLLGDTLWTPRPVNEVRLLEDLAAARAAYDREPASADALIWVGRRTAYLGRYREAIAVFTEGIRKHPDDARMYRHRGHRYITVRQLDDAIGDFQRAAELVRGMVDEVEPDGQPNARNIPTSTLQSNIWYHYGLALYLKGDFSSALEAYREDLKVARNPDMEVAVQHWLYMTLRRLGLTAEAAEVLAPVTRDRDVIENGAYHRLLLMYKGELSPDSLGASGAADVPLQDATVGYGLGNWHLNHGRKEAALAKFRQIIASGPWASFGYIAAEAEIARMIRNDQE